MGFFLSFKASLVSYLSMVWMMLLILFCPNSSSWKSPQKPPKKLLKKSGCAAVLEDNDFCWSQLPQHPLRARSHSLVASQGDIPESFWNILFPSNEWLLRRRMVPASSSRWLTSADGCTLWWRLDVIIYYYKQINCLPRLAPCQQHPLRSRHGWSMGFFPIQG